jgi:uncharacterized protein
MIERILYQQLHSDLFNGKAILLFGPRQVGKSTLVNTLLSGVSESKLVMNADDPVVRNIFDNPNVEQLRQIIADNKCIFIDEAQQISEIGRIAKLIVDTFTDIQLILSGSSSFELASATQEPLTGRKRTYFLHPVSWGEWQKYAGYLKAEQDIENRLVFGMYPDVLNNQMEQQRTLWELAESYLYKDVLMFGNLKKPDEIRKLLQALAFQVGNEVSYRELGQITGLDPKTVERYIDILEKAFIIFRLGSFSKNLRNEIKNGKKIYFYDNGIRNAVIGDYNLFSMRQDKGALWENFLVSERMKTISYSKRVIHSYFWRTAQQQEIDYLEIENNNISAFEMKFSDKKIARTPKTFSKAYNTETTTVHRGNFRDFLEVN